MNNKTTTLKCNDCKDCLETKCDVYNSHKLTKAWDELIDTLENESKIYKLFKSKIYKTLDFLSKLLSKRN